MKNQKLLPFSFPPVAKHGMLGQLAGAGAVAETARACFGGGTSTNSNAGMTDIIDYVDMASDSNASDFGDILSATRLTPVGTSNATRGLYSGGYW